MKSELTSADARHGFSQPRGGRRKGPHLIKSLKPEAPGGITIFTLSLKIAEGRCMYMCTWSLTKPGEQRMYLDISYENECAIPSHIYRDRRIDRLRLSCVNPDRMEIFQGKEGKEHKLAKRMNEDINGTHQWVLSW